jgi:hypothetical protein
MSLTINLNAIDLDDGPSPPLTPMEPHEVLLQATDLEIEVVVHEEGSEPTAPSGRGCRAVAWSMAPVEQQSHQEGNSNHEDNHVRRHISSLPRHLPNSTWVAKPEGTGRVSPKAGLETVLYADP